jgi:hypothetical protein
MDTSMVVSYTRYWTPPTQTASARKEETFSRLISAAVVDSTFRHQLLTDARTVLASGYNGEFFPLDHETRERIISIQASSLKDFAAQLLELQDRHYWGTEQC